MSTTYHRYKIALPDGQKKKLQKAYVSKTAVTLRVKPEQTGCGDELLLTATQISRLKKTAAAGKGVELKLSQTQIQNTAQRGGSLFSAMLGLARPLIKPALGALASAVLSFGAEKVLKKIFGKGFGPKEIELYKLVEQMTPAQKKSGGTIFCWKRFCDGRCSTVRRLPWYVGVNWNTFGYRLSQKNNWKRFANSTTTLTTTTSTTTPSTSKKGWGNANSTATFLWNLG